MTIEKDKYIKIPIWLVSIVLPAIITIGGGYTTFRLAFQDTKNKVEYHEKQLEKLPTQLNTKVDRVEFNLVMEQLKEINRKLDRHIEQHK